MPNLKSEIQQIRPFASLEQETHINLLRTASELGGPFRIFLKQHGLNLPLFNILNILRGQKGKGLSCSGIGERMVSRDSDITRLIDKLLGMGLAERVRSTEDRRVVLTSINAKGMALLAKIDKPMRGLEKESLGHLSEKEMKQLNALLEKARNLTE